MKQQCKTHRHTCNIHFFSSDYKNIKLNDLIDNLTNVTYESLQDPKIYSEAASQVIYSLGVGHGIVMVASHNRVEQNVIRYLMIVIHI